MFKITKPIGYVLYVITSWLPHYQLHYSWPITTAIRRIAAQLMFDKCGKHVDIGRKISFSSHFSLGDRSSVGDNTYILGKVSIGNDVMMAANCAFKPQYKEIGYTYESTGRNRCTNYYWR